MAAPLTVTIICFKVEAQPYKIILKLTILADPPKRFFHLAQLKVTLGKFVVKIQSRTITYVIFLTGRFQSQQLFVLIKKGARFLKRPYHIIRIIPSRRARL